MEPAPTRIPARHPRRVLVPLAAALGPVLVLALAGALSACGSDGGDDGAPLPLPAPGDPAPAPTGDEALVELDTSGTITGQGIGSLVVSGDGGLEYTDVDGQVEEDTLTPDERDDLVELLESADFAGAPPEPDIDDVCPDATIYAITYQQWEIGADDCTIPAEIEPVVDRLRELLGRFT